jgi:hypothetical protein
LTIHEPAFTEEPRTATRGVAQLSPTDPKFSLERTIRSALFRYRLVLTHVEAGSHLPLTMGHRWTEGRAWPWKADLGSNRSIAYIHECLQLEEEQPSEKIRAWNGIGPTLSTQDSHRKWSGQEKPYTQKGRSGFVTHSYRILPPSYSTCMGAVAQGQPDC